MILSLIFLIKKSTRMIFFLLSLELLFLSVLFLNLMLMNFLSFILFLFLGVVSSVVCLILFLYLIKQSGSDYVLF